MKRTFVGRIFSAFILSALVIGLHAETKWQTDFNAAKEQAKKENKTLLLDFTGSDWCGYCIKLKKGVWDKEEFGKYAEKNLVLVELDFPTRKKLPADLKKQNEALRNRYNIEGYPTILLLSPDGKELGRLVGYEGEGPADYVKLLEKTAKKGDKTVGPSE